MSGPAVAVLAGMVAATGVVALERARSKPAAACASWRVPEAVSPAVARRAREILDLGADYGARFVEAWEGRLYQFVVETHGPSAQIPRPHKGVGVRVCASTEVPYGAR